jgi:hypothetical protein
MPIINSNVLLVPVCKSRGRALSDAAIIELLFISFSSLVAADLNVKHPIYTRALANPSGKKLVNCLPLMTEISVQRCTTHHSSEGKSRPNMLNRAAP